MKAGFAFLVASAAALEATPLTKVVNLLKNMRAQVEKEAKEDQEIYDKLACWCHTNETEKTEATKIAAQRIERLQSQIQEYTARHSQLGTEIKQTKEDLAADEASLESATKVRESEAEKFHTLETDNVQAIAQMRAAITVLSKHNDALLQNGVVANIKDIIKHAQFKFPSLISDEDLRTAVTLLQARPYAAQSGEIFGFLKSMQETMEKSLSEAQQAEAKAGAEFQALREAKMEEIAAGRDRVEQKESEFADVGEKLAQSKEDLEDTEDALSADQAFLLDLEKRCNASDAEMEARVKTRTEEIAAINDTIEILTADEARDVANRSFNFLQKVKSEQDRYLRNKAATALKRQAIKHNNPEMAMLATAVQLDAFTKVKKAIDNMVAALKQQQADEVKHKDFCNEEFHTNEQQTTKANRKSDNLDAKKTDLEAQIKAFTDTIDMLTAEIGEARVELQRASEDRNAESKEFQKIVADQQATQEILDKATDRLAQFYNKKSFLQQEPGAKVEGPPPALREGGYQKSQGAGGVMGMLAEIKSDSKQAEQEAVSDEQSAQTAYEEFTRNTNSSIKEKQKGIVNTTENRAAADKELVVTKENIQSTLTELEKLSDYNAQLHKSCDFVVKNFEIRQTARSEEVEALGQAKSILSGAQ